MQFIRMLIPFLTHILFQVVLGLDPFPASLGVRLCTHWDITGKWTSNKKAKNATSNYTDPEVYK